MTAFYVGTKAECEALRDLDDKARGLPVKGVHVGGGRHVAMTDNPASPGWTLHVAEAREHPTQKGTWAYPVEDIPEGRLTEGARATVQARKAGAGELDETWDRGTDRTLSHL